MNLKVAVVFGGPSPEHDISILTGLQAGRVLRDARENVQLVYWTKQVGFELVPPEAEARDFLEPDRIGFSELSFDLKNGFAMPSKVRRRSTALNFDVVLNCCHGGPGEDGSLDAMLRLSGMRVSGPNAASCAVFMDKLAMSGLANNLEIATIPSFLHQPDTDIAPPFEPPWVTKPRFGGSSIGVEVDVGDQATLAALSRLAAARSGLVVQPYLKGWHDVNVAVRRYPELQLSAIERPLAKGVYDYQTKYLSGTEGMESAPRELPAVLPPAIEETIKTAVCKLANQMQVSGIPRIDFLWDGAETVLFNEVNPIPGAMGMYLWSAAGVDRAALLLDLLRESQSLPIHYGSWGGTSDGSALRVAANIASKLA